MDHLKEALMKKIALHKSKYGHDEHHDAGLMKEETDKEEQDEQHGMEIGDHAPELSADQNDQMEEEAGEQLIGKDPVAEAVASHGGGHNPMSMHHRAAIHAKSHLQGMKNKKAY